MSRFGRYQVAETPSSLMRLHIHKGQPLKEVDHEPKNGVLDQEDLIKQGIDTSKLIPGAQRVDALGSCTANANLSALSNVLSLQHYLAFTKAKSYADVVAIEEAAISFYHQCTDQTGDPSQEWPPTDCGSSGPYIVELDQHLNLVARDTIAHGAQNIVSLMQTDGVLMGSPWLNAWMEPDSNGFIDGNGSAATLDGQIAQGVAGGHETYLCAIEKLALTALGAVVPLQTVIRARNSWTKAWGDHGCYRVHLSTLVALGAYCDFRQLVPVAPVPIESYDIVAEANRVPEGVAA